MERGWAAAGAVLAGVAVAAGAFGAHALKDSLSAERLDVWDKAVRYQAFHALALFVVALWPPAPPAWARRAGWSFVAGIALFSGSLYVLALSGVRAWGAVTPVGGVAFLLGWALLAASALRRSPS